MTRVGLLKTLKVFTEAAISELVMPVRMQKGDSEQEYRTADVYLMRLSDSTAAQKKAPYIIHQVITGKDFQIPRNLPKSQTVVRSIFCVYCDDESEGGLMLLNLMERLRIELLRVQVIGDIHQLDLQEGLEVLIYPDDSAPYYIGEMISTWDLGPPVRREVGEYVGQI